MRRIHSMLNAIDDLGGIHAVAARWHPETRAIVMVQLDQAVASLMRWREVLAEDQSGTERPQ